MRKKANKVHVKCCYYFCVSEKHSCFPSVISEHQGKQTETRCNHHTKYFEGNVQGFLCLNNYTFEGIKQKGVPTFQPFSREASTDGLKQKIQTS